MPEESLFLTTAGTSHYHCAARAITRSGRCEKGRNPSPNPRMLARFSYPRVSIVAFCCAVSHAKVQITVIATALVTSGERKARTVAAVRSCEERRQDLGAPDHLHPVLHLPEMESIVCKPGHLQNSKRSDGQTELPWSLTGEIQNLAIFGQFRST